MCASDGGTRARGRNPPVAAAGARIVATIDAQVSGGGIGRFVLYARASRVGICRRRSQDKVKSASGSEWERAGLLGLISHGRKRLRLADCRPQALPLWSRTLQGSASDRNLPG